MVGALHSRIMPWQDMYEKVGNEAIINKYPHWDHRYSFPEEVLMFGS